MVSFLLVSIFLAAALSLLSYLYCWWDIQSGSPHIISLRQITNIMDRHLLDRIFGAHKEGYVYELSPQKLAFIRLVWGGYYYRELAADTICMIGAYYYMTQAAAPAFVLLFIVLATTCQAINFVFSIRLVRRWKHQIREELED